MTALQTKQNKQDLNGIHNILVRKRWKSWGFFLFNFYIEIQTYFIRTLSGIGSVSPGKGFDIVAATL